jgi:hypothetical protein
MKLRAELTILSTYDLSRCQTGSADFSNYDSPTANRQPPTSFGIVFTADQRNSAIHNSLG